MRSLFWVVEQELLRTSDPGNPHIYFSLPKINTESAAALWCTREIYYKFANAGVTQINGNKLLVNFEVTPNGKSQLILPIFLKEQSWLNMCNYKILNNFKFLRYFFFLIYKIFLKINFYINNWITLKYSSFRCLKIHKFWNSVHIWSLNIRFKYKLSCDPLNQGYIEKSLIVHLTIFSDTRTFEKCTCIRKYVFFNEKRMWISDHSYSLQKIYFL